jgi:hypothetical protein
MHLRLARSSNLRSELMSLFFFATLIAATFLI